MNYIIPSTVFFLILVVNNFYMAQQLPNSGKEENNSLLPTNLVPILIVPCNYTTLKRSCKSCNQELRCMPSNKGILKTCRGIQKYCKDGKCSRTPDESCASTKDTQDNPSQPESTSN